VNPAIAIGTISSITLKGGYDYAWGWIFWTMPFAGSIVGLLMFEFVHKSMSNEVPDEQRAAEVLAHTEPEKEELPHGEYETIGIDGDRQVSVRQHPDEYNN
jgi:hypothetical protein